MKIKILVGFVAARVFRHELRNLYGRAAAGEDVWKGGPGYH